MTFLPIVERELRVATRRRSTYWLRVSAATGALLIGSAMLLLTLIPFAGPAPSGSAMFGTLTWMSLAVALSSGLFFTSDCLSEEKREGTLGFLFLTNLRGYDVVLGKLLATSLRSVFPLVAIFPILATTLLMGGVEVGHFWRTVFAVGNAAFFSLSLGLFVSAISRHALKALAGTLLLLVLFVGFGPLVDSVGSLVKVAFMPKLSLMSPGYVFVTANYAKTFWPALIVSQAVAWVLLGAACFLARRTWQDKPTRSMSQIPAHSVLRSPPSNRSRLLSERLLEKNPVTWLVARERGQSFLIWIVVLMMLLGLLTLLLGDLSGGWWQAWSMINGGLWWVLYLWGAARACQFFAEARRTGMVELLIASPLTSRETIEGAWRGMLRLFALPVLLLVGLQLVGGLITSTVYQRQLTTSGEFGWLGIVAALVGTLVVPMNLIALTWFGLWMGLTSKNTLTATLKTIAFVYVIPGFVIYMVTAFTVPLLLFAGAWSNGGGNPSQPVMTFWWPLLFTGLPSLLSLVKSFFFWTMARRKLFGQYRQLAVRSVVPVHLSGVPLTIKPVS